MLHAHLEIIGAPGEHPLRSDGVEFTIGRHDTNDLSVRERTVSRVHATIRRGEDGQFRVRDCGSRFGTFINGERIAEHVLADGDRIRLGRDGGPELVFLHQRQRRPDDETTSRTISELRQLAALLDGLRALGSGGVLEEVLALVLDSAIDVAHAERGFIMLANEGGELEFTMGRGRGRHTLPPSEFAASRKVPEDVFRTGITQMVRILKGNAEHARTALLGIQKVLCVPLHVARFSDGLPAPETDRRRIGVLYLDSRERGAILSDPVGSTIEMLATEAAVAIENARLYRQSLENARTAEELRVAAEIQRALCPKVAPVLGRQVAVSGASVPSRAIGGDFYDYLELPGGQLGFVVGDVAGKGPPAALLSALVQGMLAFAAESSKGPADTIARLNGALLRRGIEGRFVTLFYAAIADDGLLTYCNAGHNPPLVFGRDRVRRLGIGGPIVGSLEDAVFEDDVIRLAEGESVVVFSDGIVEARNEAGDEYGDDRTLAAVERWAAGAPHDIVEHLFADVRQFCGALPQYDDMTVLALRVYA